MSHQRGSASASDDTTGLGHNAPGQAEFLKFYREYDAAEAAVTEAGADRKAVLDRAKEAGLNPISFRRAYKEAKKASDVRETEDREYRRMMKWLGMPLGTQAELFQEPSEGNGLDEQAMAGHQVHQVAAAGQTAGKAGHDRQTNRWAPGTYLHQIWDEGWVRGQEELAQTLVPPEPKRRGRPRKSEPRA